MKFLSILIIFILAACHYTYSQEEPADFNGYWYGGEAEITGYELEQARYGEVHKGEAVFIFVTEPFSRSKQVKLDNPNTAGSDEVTVMKLNMTKKFLTGIYPYSMMMSAFTPVSYDRFPHTIKVSTSSQEWCGHTFMQLNLGEDHYRLRGLSYFESEGDVDIEISQMVLEDELWTRIRLGPDELPTGEVTILPSTFYLQLRHRENKPLQAVARLEDLTSSDFSDRDHKKYSLEYKDRSLTIYFEGAFPYEILGWEETYMSGWGRAQQLTTRGKRMKTIKSAYWNKNSNTDRKLRAKLGLRTE